MPAIATLIHEYLAPVQPDDCREVNRARLAAVLKASGPVVHQAQVVSLAADGTIAREARPFAKLPATETEPERDPTDAELAAEWKLPLAAETAAVKAEPVAPAPAAPST
jgi:hypothetical protein